ncbi:FHA domain-containing protein [Streptomyces sp. NBC_00841]|uniref:FHA domain-containing protein n=1 Tax=unclassified Streptomyces TaxID=2593676 RepID=UPI002251AECD|nr:MULTISPECIES: FHA domain-containing protein [unclassified Streptomyces]MCX4535061.1 FHA domain-containing protein [Streptomyces sp. NBC_01669]WRZ99623.1 FHA domain-containing protein [Streptomyces sp. NBC_00841]
MPTCPNGHQSGSEDWCEVCGHRMAGAGAPAGAVPPPPPPPPAPGYGYPQGPGSDATQQAELCPQCRTPREAMAPFCEECRWNFLTNTATSYTPLAPQPGGPGPGGPVPGLNLPPGFQAQQGPPAPPQQRDPYEYQSSRPSQVNRPAEPLTAGPPAPGPQQAPHPFQQQGPPPPSFQQQAPPPAPSFLQQGPPPPPPFQQQSAPPSFEQSGPPAPPQPQATGDDWMLPPPSQQQVPTQQPFQSQGPNQGPNQNQAPAGWTAVIAPDREYFLAMMQRSGPEATGLNLPAYSPEQRLPLTGNQVTIGRRRHSTGESPDVDLSVPPEDPGVSHQHAVLVQQPDGSWAVVDQNSTNGTTLNGAEDPIQPYVPVPLQDGDQVHVGAWTTITIRRG